MVQGLKSDLDHERTMREALEKRVSELEQQKCEPKSQQVVGDSKLAQEIPQGFMDLSVGPHEFNTKFYFDLERGKFPKEISVKGAMGQALEDLLWKPIEQKNVIEQRLDALYMQYLPEQFICYGPGGEGRASDVVGNNLNRESTKVRNLTETEENW